MNHSSHDVLTFGPKSGGIRDDCAMAGAATIAARRRRGARTHENPIGIDYKDSVEQKAQGISYRSWA